ncbi:MAG: site-specific DNA-methyltransferase [Spirochaetota bacterium]
MKQINTIIKGNCIDIMENILPEKSVDLIFADPPYNLQLENELYRPNETKVAGVDDNWDKFKELEDYDDFTYKWLKACRRVLKDNGAIWVIGTYHNIFRVGKIIQDLGYWILNDILWVKTNPMPNFRGVRFTNAHETLIWAKKGKNSKYIFNYQAMKLFNDDLQMRSDWHIPLCTGEERLKISGKKLHSTQKPEALLRRVILSTTNTNDIVLDPFFGTGTTGAVAKKLKRRWIGIEKEDLYIKEAQKRIDLIKEENLLSDEFYITPSKKDLPKVSFGSLLEVNMVKEGDTLYTKNKKHSATICAEGSLKSNGFRGSIHKTGAYLQNKKTCNGWNFWYLEKDNTLISIDELREEYRKKYIYKKKWKIRY